MAAMLALGFSAGLPIMLVYTTLSAWLREVGVDRSTIGFFIWASFAYSLKFLWAPLTDRIRIPVLADRLGNRLAWTFLAILGVAAVLLFKKYGGVGNLLAMILFVLSLPYIFAVGLLIWGRETLNGQAIYDMPIIGDFADIIRRFGWLSILLLLISRYLFVTIGADNLAAGFAGTAIIAFMSMLVNKDFTATQYALFSSIVAFSGKSIAGFSGVLADMVDYQNFFVITALFGIPPLLAVIVSWKIKLLERGKVNPLED